MSPSESPQSTLKVLIVDDDTFISNTLKSIAVKLGCSVHCIHDGKEVSTATVAYEPDVIFLDLVLPGIDGVEIIEVLARMECKAKIVLMSGLDQRTLSSVSEVARQNHLNLTEAVTKPFAPGQVEEILRPLIESKHDIQRSDIASETTPSLGPHVLFEPEAHVFESAKGGMEWVRVDLVWLMDDHQLINIDKVLSDSLKPKMARGILEFLLRECLSAKDLLAGTSINVGIKLPISSQILLSDSAPDYLDQIVNQASLTNQAVMLELSEDTVMNSSESSFNVLSRLKIKGFKLAVCIRDLSDQSLAALNKLPIDELVLDMAGESFRDSTINNMETEFQVGSLVSFATSAGLTTAARNVSNERQLSFVTQCKLSKASGEHIQAPADSTTILNYFISQS